MTDISTAGSRAKNLRRLLSPKSVAVVGASAKEDKAGFQALKALAGFEGNVWPVNPQASEILGRRAYPTVSDIGQPVDLVILAVPPQACIPAFEDAAACECGGVLIVSGGFAEVGADGIARQDALAGIVRRSGTRLLGPNTSGFVNPHGGCRASFVPGLEKLRAGKVAVVAQSGGVNLTLAFLLHNKGVGVSVAIGLGNAVDIDTPDVLDYLSDDSSTDAIVIHLEGIADGRRLFDALRRMTPRKPVVALVAGRSEIGTFAQSHTGRLLGSFERKTAMLRQAGAIVVDSTEEAADAVAALSMVRLPPHRDPGVALVTGQAGPGLLILDHLNAAGVRVAGLAPGTIDRLRELLPPLTFVGNPVDTGRPGPTFPEVLKAVVSDGGVDLTTVFALHEPAALNPLSIGPAAQAEPVMFGTLGDTDDIAPVLSSMAVANIPCLTSPERLARAAIAVTLDSKARHRLGHAEAAMSIPKQALRGKLDEAAAKGRCHEVVRLRAY